MAILPGKPGFGQTFVKNTVFWPLENSYQKMGIFAVSRGTPGKTAKIGQNGRFWPIFGSKTRFLGVFGPGLSD